MRSSLFNDPWKKSRLDDAFLAFFSTVYIAATIANNLEPFSSGETRIPQVILWISLEDRGKKGKPSDFNEVVVERSGGSIVSPKSSRQSVTLLFHVCVYMYVMRVFVCVLVHWPSGNGILLNR